MKRQPVLLAAILKAQEDILTQAKEKHPSLPPAGVMLGIMYARANNPAAARNAYERAVRDAPDDPEAYVVFGDNALRQRNVTDAGLLFDRAVQKAEAYTANDARKNRFLTRAYSGSASVAEARESWEEAESWLRKAIELDAENIGYLTRLGRVLFKRNQEEAAYKIFQQVNEINPSKVARAEINMARLYQELGKEANAEKLITRVVDRDPGGLATQIAAAQWAIENGKVDFLRKCAERAAKADPNDLQSLVLQGFIARMDADYPKAEELFTKALEQAPSNAVTLNQLAVSLVEQPDEAKRRRAAEYAQIATLIHSDRTRLPAREATVTFAWVLHRLGRSLDAQRLLQSALSAGGVGPEASYFCAEILQKRGNTQVAKQLAEVATNTKQVYPSRAAAEELLSTLGG